MANFLSELIATFGGLLGLIFAGFVSLASQNCRLCSARSMAVLSDALVITAPTMAPDQNRLAGYGCDYRLANNLLRSRVGAVRKVGYSRCFDCGTAQSLSEEGKTPRGGVGRGSYLNSESLFLLPC